MAKKQVEAEIDVYRTTNKSNRHTEDGKEILNPTPMQPPLGYNPQPSMMELIRQQIRQYKHLDDTEPETEEEADDFDIAEDPLPESPWENDMIPSIKETRKRLKELEKEARLYAKQPDPVSATDDKSETESQSK